MINRRWPGKFCPRGCNHIGSSRQKRPCEIVRRVRPPPPAAYGLAGEAPRSSFAAAAFSTNLRVILVSSIGRSVEVYAISVPHEGGTQLRRTGRSSGCYCRLSGRGTARWYGLRVSFSVRTGRRNISAARRYLTLSRMPRTVSTTTRTATSRAKRSSQASEVVGHHLDLLLVQRTKHAVEFQRLELITCVS